MGGLKRGRTFYDLVDPIYRPCPQSGGWAGSVHSPLNALSILVRENLSTGHSAYCAPVDKGEVRSKHSIFQLWLPTSTDAKYAIGRGILAVPLYIGLAQQLSRLLCSVVVIIVCPCK